MAQHLREIANKLWKLYQASITSDVNENDIDTWLEYCYNAIQSTQYSLHTPNNLKISDKQKLQAAIALINTVRHFLRERQVSSGLQEENVTG